MFSPGKYYLEVPKDRIGNLEFRLGLLESVRRHGRKARDAIRKMCKEDILFYINVFGFQYNPDKVGQPDHIGPFITYDFQDDALREILWCVENRRDLSIQKSRFMGASWLCLWAQEWLWHWHEYIKMLCVSRDANSVDEKDNPDSLFYKIDFMHEHMPIWLLPNGYDRKKHRKTMVITNPETRSSITGTASTSKAGVGGRATVMFVDEFSQIDDDYDLFNRSSNTSSCRIFNGTHLGLDTCFYEINDPTSVVGAYIKRLTMHWTQHPDWNQGMYHYDPEKQRIVPHDKSYVYPPDFKFVTSGMPTGGPFPGVRSPRYDHEVLRKTSQRAVAMDIDIDPHGAGAQFFDAPMIYERIRNDARKPHWVGRLEYTTDGRPLRLVEEEKGGCLEIWCPLTDGRPPESDYTMGCDPSHGTGATPTCVCILDARTGEKVGQYTSAQVSGADFAPYYVALARLFQDEAGTPAYIAWEHTGPGVKMGQKIMNELRFKRIYWRDMNPMGKKHKKTDNPGWYATPALKLLLLEDYKAALKSGNFCNRSEAALKECLKFIFAKKGVRHGGDEPDDESAARDNHGDHVIADALAYMLAKELGYMDVAGVKKQPEQIKAPVKMGSFEWRQKRVEEEERNRRVSWGSRRRLHHGSI